MTFITNATGPLFYSQHARQEETTRPSLVHSLQIIDQLLTQSEESIERDDEEYLLALKTLSTAKDEEIEKALTLVNLSGQTYSFKDKPGIYVWGDDPAAWNAAAEALVQRSHPVTVLLGLWLLVAVKQEDARCGNHFLGENFLSCYLEEDDNAREEESKNLHLISALRCLRQLLFFPADASDHTVETGLQHICRSNDDAFRRSFIKVLVDMGYKNHIFNYYANACSNTHAAIEGEVEQILLNDVESNSYKRKVAKKIDYTSFSHAAKRYLKSGNNNLTTNHIKICKEAICQAFEHTDSKTILECLDDPKMKHIVYDLLQKNTTPHSYFITMAALLIEEAGGCGHPSLKYILFDTLLVRAHQSGECLKMAYRLLQSVAIQEPDHWKKLLDTAEQTKWGKIKAEINNAFISSPPNLPEEDLFSCWNAVRYQGTGNGDLTDKVLREACKNEPVAHQKTLVLLFEILEKHRLESTKKNTKVKHPTKIAEFKQALGLVVKKMEFSDTNIYLAKRVLEHKKIFSYLTRDEISAFIKEIKDTKEKQKNVDILRDKKTPLDLFAATLRDCILNKTIDLADLYTLTSSINDRPTEGKDEQLAFVNIWSILWEALLKESLFNPQRELFFSLIIDSLINRCCASQTHQDEIYRFILDRSKEMIARKLINKKNFIDYFVNISTLTIVMLKENSSCELYHAFINKLLESKIFVKKDAAFLCYQTLGLGNDRKGFHLSLQAILGARELLTAIGQSKKKNITNKEILVKFQEKIKHAKGLLKNVEDQFSYMLSTKEIDQLINFPTPVSDSFFEEMKNKLTFYTKEVLEVWWVDDKTFSTYFSTIQHYTKPFSQLAEIDRKNVIQLQACGIENINHLLFSIFSRWHEMAIDPNMDERAVNSLLAFNGKRRIAVNKLLDGTKNWLMLDNATRNPLRQNLVNLIYNWLKPNYYIALLKDNPEKKFKIDLPEQIEIADFYDLQNSIVDFLNRLKLKKLNAYESIQIAEILTVITYNLVAMYKLPQLCNKNRFVLAVCHALTTFSLKSLEHPTPAEVRTIYEKHLIPHFTAFNSLTQESKGHEESFDELFKVYGRMCASLDPVCHSNHT